MSFETSDQNNANTQSNEQAQQPAAVPARAQRTVLVLRARQMALDVVLDNVSLIRAQARIMECVDKDDWAEAFNLIKEEVQHQRDELLSNATLIDTVRMAEDTGEDIVSLAERTGTSYEDIADAFEQMRNDKVQLQA